jgi:5'-nucleotidase
VQFATAGFFTRLFAERMMNESLPPDVHVLKIDVPANATPQTPWRAVRQAMQPYYVPRTIRTGTLDSPGPIGYDIKIDSSNGQKDTDVHALAVEQVVAVTPLSLDMTSRTPMDQLDTYLRNL